jgi:hypothetical protein
METIGFNCSGVIHHLTNAQVSKSDYLKALVNQDQSTAKKDGDGNFIIDEDPLVFMYVTYLLQTGSIDRTIAEQYKDRLSLYMINVEREYPESFEQIRARESIVRNNYKTDKIDIIKLTDDMLIRKDLSMPNHNLLFYESRLPSKLYTGKMDDYRKYGIIQGIISDDFDFTNICIAGGSVVSVLLGRTINDIDIFLVIDEPDVEKREKIAMDKIRYITRYLAKGKDVVARMQNVISIIVERGIRIEVQIILRIYRSINEILCGFDIDSCCFAYDGKDYLTTERGLHAIQYGVNCVDFTRLSPTYEMRLVKYAKRGFKIYVPYFERQRIDVIEYQHIYNKQSTQRKTRGSAITKNEKERFGLSYLIYAESLHINKRSECIDAIPKRSDYGHVLYDGRYNKLPVRVEINGRVVHLPNIYILEYNECLEEYLGRILDDEEGESEDDKDTDAEYDTNPKHIISHRIRIIMFDVDSLREDEDFSIPDAICYMFNLPQHVTFITENPGQQLTSSFHAIVLQDNNEWYGKIMKKSYKQLVGSV